MSDGCDRQLEDRLRPHSLAEQFGWTELPPPEADPGASGDALADALDDEACAILETAHRGMRGPARAPSSASKPRINLFTRRDPAIATVTGNLRVTDDAAESDVRYIVLDFGTVRFPFLEGQNFGVILPGTGPDGRPHAMRLYSVASARDGERPNTNNLALTVKRIVLPDAEGVFRGVASNWLCDLRPGDTIPVAGPFGASFLMPDDPASDLLMVCTGTGVAPFRGFTHRRRRTTPDAAGKLFLFFGARSPRELPYFGPLRKYLRSQLDCELVYPRLPGVEKEYVQHRLRKRAEDVARLLRKRTLYLYICGLQGLEQEVECALSEIGHAHGIEWPSIRQSCDFGRLHIESY